MKNGDNILAKILINGDHLSQVLNSIQGPHVALKFCRETDLLVVEPINEPHGCKTMHIITPRRDDSID